MFCHLCSVVTLQGKPMWSIYKNSKNTAVMVQLIKYWSPTKCCCNIPVHYIVLIFWHSNTIFRHKCVKMQWENIQKLWLLTLPEDWACFRVLAWLSVSWYSWARASWGFLSIALGFFSAAIVADAWPFSTASLMAITAACTTKRVSLNKSLLFKKTKGKIKLC